MYLHVYIRPLRTLEDYESALDLVDFLWTAPEGSYDYDCFEILCELIANYEEKTWPIDLPDPIEALKYYMQHQGFKEDDLDALLKSQTLAKNILSKITPLTLPIVYQLYKIWKLPPHSFLKPYLLTSEDEEWPCE